MNPGDEVSYDAFVEAYCLITSYVREEGKVGAKYDMDYLKEFTTFLAKVMADPEWRQGRYLVEDTTPRRGLVGGQRLARGQVREHPRPQVVVIHGSRRLAGTRRRPPHARGEARGHDPGESECHALPHRCLLRVPVRTRLPTAPTGERQSPVKAAIRFPS